MSLKLQNDIIPLFSTTTNTDFLDLCVTPNFFETNPQLPVSAKLLGIKLSQIFLLSDFLSYLAIIALILMVGSKYTSENLRVTSRLVAVSTIFVYASSLSNIYGLIIGSSFLKFYTLLLFDSAYTFTLFTQFSKLFLLFIAGSLYSMFVSTYRSKMSIMELPLLMHILVALSVTLLSSNNFALLLLALEAFSLTLYVMTTIGRSYGGVTAAAKYFAFGTLGSVFLFWGVAHLYALVPSLSFRVMRVVFESAYLEDAAFTAGLEFASTVIVFGFMLKLGAAPLHQWVADVYAGSHMYVTAIFSTFVKFVLFVIFFRMLVYITSDSILKIFVPTSLLIGCVMSVRQTEIKRLIAYSSIVHVAFLLMGDSTSSLIYLLTYTISSLLLFSVLLTAQLSNRELIYLSDLRFIRRSSHFQNFCLVVSLASSAGLPPFAGFYGKFLVWSSLVENIYLVNDTYSYLILFLSIGVSLVSIFYYTRVVAYLFVSDDIHPWSAAFVDATTVSSNSQIFSTQFVLSFMVCFWTFIQPHLLGAVQYSVYLAI